MWQSSKKNNTKVKLLNGKFFIGQLLKDFCMWAQFPEIASGTFFSKFSETIQKTFFLSFFRRHRDCQNLWRVFSLRDIQEEVSFFCSNFAWMRSQVAQLLRLPKPKWVMNRAEFFHFQRRRDEANEAGGVFNSKLKLKFKGYWTLCGFDLYRGKAMNLNETRLNCRAMYKWWWWKRFWQSDFFFSSSVDLKIRHFHLL